MAARSRLEELAALTPGHFVRAGDLLGESTGLEKQRAPASGSTSCMPPIATGTARP